MAKRNLKRQKQTLTPTQLQQELRDRAMPDVKALVKKYGRPAVGWCVNQLRELEKKMKDLERAKDEVEKLEAELKD